MFNVIHRVSFLGWLFEKIVYLYLPPPPTNVNDDSTLNIMTFWSLSTDFRQTEYVSGNFLSRRIISRVQEKIIDIWCFVAVIFVIRFLVYLEGETY